MRYNRYSTSGAIRIKRWFRCDSYFMASFRLRVFLKGRVLNTGLVKTKDCGWIRLARTEASVRQSMRLFLLAGPAGSESSTGGGARSGSPVGGSSPARLIRTCRTDLSAGARRADFVGNRVAFSGDFRERACDCLGRVYSLVGRGRIRAVGASGNVSFCGSRSPSPIRIRRCAATGCFCRGRYEVRCSGRGAAGRRELRGVRCSAAGASWFLPEERRSECFGGRFG